eukprot:4655095-Amphidinium_carterae.1
MLGVSGQPRKRKGGGRVGARLIHNNSCWRSIEMGVEDVWNMRWASDNPDLFAIMDQRIASNQ